MNILPQSKIDSNRKVYQNMVGKEVTLMVTGLRVKGTVKAFTEDEYTFNLEVEHEPVNWGGEIYTEASPFARKCDNWGSLNKVELIEN